MRRTRVAFVLFIALLAVVALAGCTQSTGSDPAALEGTWTVESFGAPEGLTPADPAVTSQITLEGGKASGNGGVNSFSGTYETEDGTRLRFGPLAATEMAGPPAAMEQESAFFAALNDTRNYEINEGKLVLAGRGNDTLVILVAK